MDNLNDITDDLLCLPGFIRRNLLLIRDLDLKSTQLFNEANRLSQSLFGPDYNMTSSHRDRLNSDRSSTAGSDKHLHTPSEKTQSRSNDSTNSSRDSDRKGGLGNKRKLKDEQTFIENTKQFDDIQNLRMQGIYVLQEKIDVNNQITSMLKYEYENLKSKFDAIYTEMDLKGQIPHELKVYISSNKKKAFYPGVAPAPPPPTEASTTSSNHMDIAAMFKNIVNAKNTKPNEEAEASETVQEHKPSESHDEGTDPNGLPDLGSKIVNRHVPAE